MVIKFFPPKLVVIWAISFLLTNCTKTTGDQTETPLPAPFYTKSAATYLSLAENQWGEERQENLLLAAGRLLQDGRWREANSILNQMDSLTPIQKDKKAILSAKVSILTEQPKKALNQLAMVHRREELSSYYQQNYHATLAEAYEGAAQFNFAVVERIRYDRMLKGEPVHRHNRRLLWNDLNKLPLAELNTLILEAKSGSELEGWLALALVSKQNKRQGRDLLAHVEQWRQLFPKHPANSILPNSLNALASSMVEKPKQIALLLPLSGPLAGPGNAIRDGFNAAYQASENGQVTQIKWYDTSKQEAGALYDQAIADGADYVIGPLLKSDVAKVAALHHPVPTLLLNEMETKGKKNTYRFGLSPSNEAKQVAMKASKNGLQRALIISPDDVWGKEIVNAFTQQWQIKGGEIVDNLAYNDKTNLNVSVRQLLHVNEKEAEKKLTREEELVALPKRRQDFDFIFLLAYPTKARQIMPLLKYYFAADVPVYATSTVYAGNTNILRDKDLDGIIFCDIPYVFNHQLASRNWPEQFNSYSRLYAIGMDSYALATDFNRLLVFPTVKNNTGLLYLNQNPSGGHQEISRVLAWGRIQGGVARATYPAA